MFLKLPVRVDLWGSSYVEIDGLQRDALHAAASGVSDIREAPEKHQSMRTLETVEAVME